MQVEFGLKQLLKAYERSEIGTRQWGEVIARKYIQRVNTLFAASSWADLQTIRALRLHLLKGSRQGQWAIDLHDRWRLVVEKVDEQTVRIREVSQHYDD